MDNSNEIWLLFIQILTQNFYVCIFIYLYMPCICLYGSFLPSFVFFLIKTKIKKK